MLLKQERLHPTLKKAIVSCIDFIQTHQKFKIVLKISLAISSPINVIEA